jgi:hypothetical protein
MHRALLAILVLISLISSSTAAAQEYEQILVPLQLIDTPGAFGSVWSTRVAVSNISETPIDVQGYGECPVPCTPPPIPPQGTVYISTMRRSEVQGAFLAVEKGRVGDLSITIRTVDQSREHLTWGATLPVITQTDLFKDRFGIGDIPVTDEFRSTLRIYDFDARTPGAVRVRIYRVTGSGPPTPVPANPDPLIAELFPAFATPVSGNGVFGHPGYASVPLWLLPEVQEAGRVRVVVEPLDTTGEYWAFVSSTHNETQHVTVLAPR